MYGVGHIWGPSIGVVVVTKSRQVVEVGMGKREENHLGLRVGVLVGEKLVGT